MLLHRWLRTIVKLNRPSWYTLNHFTRIYGHWHHLCLLIRNGVPRNSHHLTRIHHGWLHHPWLLNRNKIPRLYLYTHHLARQYLDWCRHTWLRRSIIKLNLDPTTVLLIFDDIIIITTNIAFGVFYVKHSNGSLSDHYIRWLIIIKIPNLKFDQFFGCTTKQKWIILPFWVLASAGMHFRDNLSSTNYKFNIRIYVFSLWDIYSKLSASRSDL